MPKSAELRLRQVHPPRSIRTSVSLPPDLHESLELLAKEKKVSVAWVIRDAAEKYVKDHGSLQQQKK